LDLKSKQFLASEHLWAKKLPQGWRHEFFKEVLKDTVDNRGRTVPTSDSGIPLIATNCISNNSLYPKFVDVRYVSKSIYDNWFRSGHAEPNNLLFANKGENCGKICLCPSPVNFCFAQDMIGLKADEEKIDFRYLLAVLRSKFMQEQFFAFRVDSVIPHLRKTDFDKIIIPIPEKNLEKFIGKYYLTLSKKIETLQNQNKILNEIGNVVFKSRLINFDGIIKFEDSEVEKIPKGWKKDTIYNCAKYVNGSAFRDEDFSIQKKGKAIIKILELKYGISSSTKFTTKKVEPKYNIKNNDILFSWSGSPDTSIDIFIWMGGDAILNQHIHKIGIKNPNEKPFVYFLLKYFKKTFVEIARNKQTTGLGHVTMDDLKKLQIVLPNEKEMELFYKISNPIFNSICNNLLNITRLTELRDNFLENMMSGKIKI
jgi:type I restriction enzyme, S subunit